MSYTVNEMYNRVLEESDKLGSDYFTLVQVKNAFKKEVLDFVGARAKDAELNQEVTDDIRSLVVPTTINFIPNPDDAKAVMAALPNNYFAKLSLNVLYSDGLTSRVPTIERFGENNTNSVSPYKKPERMYPLIQQFANYFNVKCGIPAFSPITPQKLVIVYIKKPTFGNQVNDICVDLPDQVCESMFANVATNFFLTTGDERAGSNFQADRTYREK